MTDYAQDARQRMRFAGGLEGAAEWADVVVELTPDQVELLRPYFARFTTEPLGAFVGQLRDSTDGRAYVFARVLLGAAGEHVATACRAAVLLPLTKPEGTTS